MQTIVVDLSDISLIKKEWTCNAVSIRMHTEKKNKIQTWIFLNIVIRVITVEKKKKL